MTPLKFSEKRAWPGTHDPLNIGGLNANCRNMVADFKFDKHVACDSPNMTFKNFKKGGVPRVTSPLYFWELNVNCSNTVKVIEFRFYKHVPRDNPDMTPLKFSEKVAWPGTHDPINFWGLNANCSNMVKDTDFKFQKRVPGDSSDMTL